jgi:hypothetical protein
MKRITAIVASVALAALAAGPALADSGTPGTTFPEQPGGQPQTACAALVSNSGALSAPRSETAFAITNGLFGDACSGD